MYKKFVMGIAAMAALTLVSCSSDDLDSLSDNSSKNEAINFDGYLGRSAVAVNGSRGSVLEKDDLKKSTDGFGVFGKYNAGAGQTSNSDFFKNQKVTYSTTESKWKYSPLKFWPANGQIDFFAYAPYVENTTLNNTSFVFNVADNAAGQTDLLWANTTSQISPDLSSTKKEVKLQFKHALSRLGYTVKLSGNYPSDQVTFTLNNITLAGSPDGTKNAFYNAGTIDLSKKDATGLWDTSSSNSNETKLKFEWFSDKTLSYPVKITYVDPTNTEEKLVSNSKEDYLFVIPQNFSEKIGEAENPDKLYVIVKYTITYTNDATHPITNTVYKKLPINFLQGKAYKLNLTIGLPIEFDVDVDTVNGVDPWDEQPDTNIDSWDDIKHE